MSRAKAGAVRAFAAILALWIGGTLSVPAEGAQWQFDPRVGFSGTYDDNYRLGSTAQDTFSVYGGSLDGSFALKRTTPTTTTIFLPRLWSSFFPGHREENANDQFAFFSFDRKGRTSDAGVKVDYRRQTLLKENLPNTDVNTGLGQPSRGTDIGVLFSRARQTLLLVDPYGQLTLTPRQSLELKGEFLDTRYSRQASQDYLPYKNVMGSLGYQFATSLRSTLIFRGIGSKFIPDQGGDSTTYGGEGEWSSRVTEKSQYYVRAGIQHTEFDANTAVGTPARSSNSFAGGAGVNWSFQVTTVFVDAIRSVSPSSQGSAVLQDLLRVRVEHRVTPRLADFVGVTGLKNQNLGGAAGASLNLSDRRYVAAIAGLEWRMYRQWSLTGTYSYTWQQYVARQTTAHSNGINISVIYEPHRPENDRAITVAY